MPLEQMSISLEGIGHLLADKLIAIPMYQRSYAWETRHVTDLLHDISDALTNKESEYFLGSIVITSQTSNRPEVVDGQQRLATISILIAAIRDWLVSQGEPNQPQDIETRYLATRDFRTQELDARLRLNELDHDYFKKTILSRPDSPDRQILPSRESHRRIKIAAELAKQHIEKIVTLTNRPVDSLADWIEYINSNVKIICVSVPTYANAFTIFETLNDRGLDLAISDLLKNHLFHLSGDRISEAQQRWISMFGALEAVGGENVAVDYIRHYWSSKYGATREKDLYDNIKTKITSKQSAIDFASELSQNARLYAAILNSSHELWKEYGATTKEHMVTINLLRMVQIRPLLLAIISTFTKAEIKKSLPLMISWGVRFLIYGGLGGGVLERQYSEIARKVRDGEIKNARNMLASMKTVVPSDREFQTAFSTARVSTAYLARYYLRALEKQSKGEPNPELVPNPNEEVVNLEHILPDNPSSAWSHIDAETASAYVNRIGNLALLKSINNTLVGNDSFAQKKSSYFKSEYTLTSALALESQWSHVEIENRQKVLSELAVGTWPNKIT